MTDQSMLTNGRFAGKVALVTGGASGIGEAVCRRLLKEGARVVGGDVNDERLGRLSDELGERFLGVHADVRVESEVETLVAATARFGSLDCAFNVAGGARSGGGITTLSEDDWDFTLDVSLKGVFLSMKHEGRTMAESGNSGSITIVSSLNSEVPMFGGAAYCSAKAGAAMLAKCGALELAEHGIRVNAISPGLTDTPLTASLLAVPSVVEAYLRRIPLNRAATPEEIASTALFLASDEAAYISGVNLFVDGAWATTGYPDLRAFRGLVMSARAEEGEREGSNNDR